MFKFVAILLSMATGAYLGYELGWFGVVIAIPVSASFGILSAFLDAFLDDQYR